MAVPKRKTSHSKRNKRRSHDSIAAPNVISCPDCGEPVMRHRACIRCGNYRGRKMFEVVE